MERSHVPMCACRKGGPERLGPLLVRLALHVFTQVVGDRLVVPLGGGTRGGTCACTFPLARSLMPTTAALVTPPVPAWSFLDSCLFYFKPPM